MFNKKEIGIAILLIGLSVIIRIVDNTFNLFHFTPVIAISLFSGTIIKDKKLAFATPFLAMLISDIYFQLFTNIPGFYGISQVVNYSSVLLIVFIGSQIRSKNISNVVAYTLSSSLLFFIVSNFGVWLAGYYGYTMMGLGSC